MLLFVFMISWLMPQPSIPLWRLPVRIICSSHCAHRRAFSTDAPFYKLRCPLPLSCIQCFHVLSPSPLDPSQPPSLKLITDHTWFKNGHSVLDPSKSILIIVVERCDMRGDTRIHQLLVTRNKHSIETRKDPRC